MPVRVRLLGRPGLERDGRSVTLQGRKTWGLLAYLLLEARPPTRRELVDRLWSDADDPLGAARWTLSQVRRSLEGSAAIAERHGRLVLEPLVPLTVDAVELLAGRWDAATVDEIASGELLTTWDFDTTPAFAQWLAIQRARVSGAARDALRSAATVLARSDPERALALAERALVAEPYDDGLHALVVHIHLDRGDAVRARGYADDVARRYRDELDSPPPASLAAALGRVRVASTPHASVTAIQLQTLLDTAHARTSGGDYAHGFEMAQRAAFQAAASGERALEMQALIHATNYMTNAQQGGPREWNALLQRASALATELRDRRALCEIERERGRIAAMRGSYGAAEAALRRSLALATELGEEHLAALARLFLGVCETDRGDHLSAERDLRAAVSGHRRTEVPMAWLARLLVRMARYDEAEGVAAQAIALMREHAHPLQLALALAQSAEARLARADENGAREQFAAALTVAQETGDHDWTALALRGLALVDLRDGRPERARQIMREALEHATKRPACYRWVEALVLADLAEMERGVDPALVERGLAIALAAPMPDLAERFRVLQRSHTPAHTVAP